MRDNTHKESKRYILRGLALLLLGCGLLLVCKLPVAELLGDLAAYAGGVVMLYGNYCIIFGLLIFAGDESP